MCGTVVSVQQLGVICLIAADPIVSRLCSADTLSSMQAVMKHMDPFWEIDKMA